METRRGGHRLAIAHGEVDDHSCEPGFGTSFAIDVRSPIPVRLSAHFRLPSNNSFRAYVSHFVWHGQDIFMHSPAV